MDLIMKLNMIKSEVRHRDKKSKSEISNSIDYQFDHLKN